MAAPGTRAARLYMLVDFTPKRDRTLDLFFGGLARTVAARGWPVDVAFANPPPAEYTRALVAAGVRVGQLPFPFSTASARELSRRLRTHPATVLQAHFLGPFDPRLLALKAVGAARGLEVVDHLSGSLKPLPRVGEWVRAGRGRLAGLLVDEYVAVSRFVADRIARAGVPARRIRVIENGIPLDRYTRAPGAARTGPPRVAFAGQLIEEKGVQVLLEAARQLPGMAEWVVAGAGRFREALEQLAARLGVPARFVGHVDSAELFRGADVVVVPSLWEEAFGLVAVEGMAAGAAVVVSDAGGLPEVVGDAGVVVPRGDAGALAAALRDLLGAPARRAALGLAATRRAQARFSLGRMIDEHADAAERLLRSAETPARGPAERLG